MNRRNPPCMLKLEVAGALILQAGLHAAEPWTQMGSHCLHWDSTQAQGSAGMDRVAGSGLPTSLLPCKQSLTDRTTAKITPTEKRKHYLGRKLSCFFPKLVMGVTAWSAVWFNLIATAYKTKRHFTLPEMLRVLERTDENKQALTSGLSVR